MPQRVTSGTSGLKAAQQRALVELEASPGASLTRSDYQRLTGVGRSQAAYDLTELVSARVLVRVGGGRSTKYVLAHEPAAQRRWTPDRIRRELETFCAGRSVWPSAREFKSSGRGDLYVAASRYGGVAFWARELGLGRVERSSGVVTAPARFRSRLAWALAGGAAAIALGALAATAVVAIHDSGSGPRTAARKSTASQSANRAVDEPQHRPPRAAPVAVAPAKTASRVRHRLTRQTVRSAPRVQYQAPPVSSFVSRSRYTASSRAAPATATVATASGGGPAPLPAPAGGSAPSPLRAPSR